MQNKLLILTKEVEEFRDEILKRNLPDLEVIAPTLAAEIPRYISEANIILANPGEIKPFLNHAKKLQWLQCTFTGVDALLAPGLRRDYLLTNVRDVYGEIIAEYVFTYIFYIEKEVGENIAHQQNHFWTQKESYTAIGKTLGVLGVGSIGTQIARIARAFGMRTLGYRKTNSPREYFDEIFVHERIAQFYSQCDYVVSALPQTNATTGIVNRAAFYAMKPTAIFLNVGRGGAVVSADLLEALEQNVIRAAVLDVFTEEPLPESSPLWSTPRLYLTPHISGYLNSKRIFDIFEENYGLFRERKTLNYRVDFEKGY